MTCHAWKANTCYLSLFVCKLHMLYTSVGGTNNKVLVVSTIFNAYVRVPVHSTASSAASPLMITLQTRQVCQTLKCVAQLRITNLANLPADMSSRMPASNSSSLTPGLGSLAEVNSLCWLAAKVSMSTTK